MPLPFYLLCISLCFLTLAVGFVIAGLTLLKRLDNADARIVRLESAVDAIFAGKKAMEPPDKIVKLRCKPDANCRKCHGRGHIGRNHSTGLFIACVCCS